VSWGEWLFRPYDDSMGRAASGHVEQLPSGLFRVEVHAGTDPLTGRRLRLKGDAVVCPCHGSTFRLDGSLVKGPPTVPQPALQVRVESGKVEVKAAKSQD
jgi:hypothetical protein